MKLKAEEIETIITTKQQAFTLFEDLLFTQLEETWKVAKEIHEMKPGETSLERKFFDYAGPNTILALGLYSLWKQNDAFLD